MDLNTITAVIRPHGRDDLPAWQAGDAVLGGGTWLFSEPQPHLRRLIDLTACAWEPVEAGSAGLSIAATCTLAALDAFAAGAHGWSALALAGPCCRALYGSFKILNQATVGGNLCLALPAGPMTALCAALDGICLIWTPGGGERPVPVLDFVTDAGVNALRPGEILRRIDLPARTLARRAAFRQVALSPEGRSGALLIGTRDTDGAFDLTVTAATRRPVRLAFDALPDEAALAVALDGAVPAALWYDDVHGRPDWRRHVAVRLALEIRRELAR
ncbi:FAD binding domain-containing protein [Marinivivus vitaminiproducens]|uniref:FAD binding domain-containing protein n=1 Tax=Marinivivus vitaminiproducens TaxID=3035935 RepID=UPI0027A339BD|nr:FAD binding domain-containing protein [Geminicoccaceae bacterium SCSIO 64248]